MQYKVKIQLSFDICGARRLSRECLVIFHPAHREDVTENSKALPVPFSYCASQTSCESRPNRFLKYPASDTRPGSCIYPYLSCRGFLRLLSQPSAQCMLYELRDCRISYKLSLGCWHPRAIAEIPSRTPTQITTLGEKPVFINHPIEA